MYKNELKDLEVEELTETVDEYEETVVKANQQGEEVDESGEITASEEIDNEERDEEVMAVLDIQDIRAAEAKPSSKKSSKAADIRVINTSKNGKRIVIKGSIIEYLQTEELDIGFTEKEMIITLGGIGISDKPFKVRSYGKQYALYNSGLVDEVTKFFELDFSNCTTNRLETKEIKLTGGVKAIVVGL